MTLDLVGKLHRTVYIVGCPGDACEDLAQLVLRRCGVIEAWDVEEKADDEATQVRADSSASSASDDNQRRITIVFQSVNSVSNALTFNGLSFLDVNSKLIVWRANDAPPPTLLHRQMAISAGKDAARTHAENEGSDASTAAAQEELQQQQEQERIRRREERAARREALQNALGIGSRNSAALDYSRSSAARSDKLKELCYRQLKALCVLTAAAVEEAKRECTELQQQVQMRQSLLVSSAASGTTNAEGMVTANATRNEADTTSAQGSEGDVEEESGKAPLPTRRKTSRSPRPSAVGKRARTKS